MYIEKEFLLKKINEYCSLYSLDLDFEAKYKFSTEVSRFLDKHRVISSDEFLEIIDHNQQLEEYNEIDFNDEIVSIEEVGYDDTIDIEVDGNHLFYANDILTHNSAVNNTDASNDAVSDSIGTVSTADFIVFLLQNEEMKARNVITCKCTKNRFTGRTDTWDMGIDYEHMRFNDLLVSNASMNEKEIQNIIDDTYKEDLRIIRENSIAEDDFGDLLTELGIS